ncbi:AP2/ERF transcription factor [Parasponia andersonii]|uniref:AP2/ERF transcription factor n=1 Tax=Parasponia andersonii TaxID=3476 RepID=A0A2P5BJ45_PARAD|nr:AP2/ERF transcription factor [Parasponia andersonii]
MEDDSSSMVSSAKTNIVIAATAETSCSINTNYAVHNARSYHHKRPRDHDHDHDRVDTNCDNTNVMNIASSSARFKGVVQQQNGHWGAQIYANHQRIWLGTFKSEKEAAMAYDSAAIRLRNGDTHRNFPWTNFTHYEPEFQNHYTAEAILNMIKDGSYQFKFEEFLRARSEKREICEINSTTNHYRHHDNHHLNQQIRVDGDAQFLCRQLFQKELTPSDVGKLNRLVIPKKYAVKYFPYVDELENNNNNNKETENGVEDIELVFYDKLMRSWKFRYCYWRSSQSFVFTRGWNRFVKENNLKANDVITFYTCHKGNVHGMREENGQIFCLIDVTHNGVSESQMVKVEYLDDHGDKFDQGSTHECKYKEAETSNTVEEKGFRLFGVDIK